MQKYPLPVNRVLKIIVFTGLLAGNCCFAGISGHDSLAKALTQTQKECMVYVGFVGRKMIKPFRRMDNVVEIYRLPQAVITQLKKLQFSPDRYNYKNIQKQQLLLASFNDSCQVYLINSPVKYKYFYPQGLKKGMVISGNELSHWDFADKLDIKQLNTFGHEKPDSLSAVTQTSFLEDATETDMPENNEKETVNPGENKSGTLPMTVPAVVPGTRAYQFHPWDTGENLDSHTPYDPSFSRFADSLYKHISGFSGYLGAQRIKLELFDQPFAADFYSGIYIHYVDSIANILKKNPLIQPGEYERFITEIAQIITTRFKYGANTMLWKGIRRDRLDCDNTAYLVYDVGKKLGFEVLIVSVWGHALAVVGDYAYETTRREYFPKENLPKHYTTIYWITSDPKKIHAFLSIFELTIYLEDIKEDKKAEDFKKIGPRYFPGIKGHG